MTTTQISRNRLMEMWNRCCVNVNHFYFCLFGPWSSWSLRGAADHNRLINVFKKDFFYFLHCVHWKRHSCPQKQLSRIICCSSMPPAFHFNFPPWFYHESSFQAQFPLILHLTFFFHSPHPHPKHPLWWQACAMCQWDEMKSGNSATQNTHTCTWIHTDALYKSKCIDNLCVLTRMQSPTRASCVRQRVTHPPEYRVHAQNTHTPTHSRYIPF